MSLYHQLKKILEKEDVIVKKEYKHIQHPKEESIIHHHFCEITLYAAPRAGVFNLDDEGLAVLNQKLEALSVPFQDIPESPIFFRVGSWEDMVRQVQEPKPDKFYVHNYEPSLPYQRVLPGFDVGKIFLEETVGHIRHRYSYDHNLSLESGFQDEFGKDECKDSARIGSDISELRRSITLYLFPSVDFLSAWDKIDVREEKRKNQREDRFYDPLFEELGLNIIITKYHSSYQIHPENYAKFSAKHSSTLRAIS